MLSALLVGAAMVADPEYTQATAELRNRQPEAVLHLMPVSDISTGAAAGRQRCVLMMTTIPTPLSSLTASSRPRSELVTSVTDAMLRSRFRK